MGGPGGPAPSQPGWPLPQAETWAGGFAPAWGSAGQRTERAALLSLGLLFPFLFHAFLFCLSYHLLFFISSFPSFFFLFFVSFPFFDFLYLSFSLLFSLHFFSSLFLSFPLSFSPPPRLFFLHPFHFSLFFPISFLISFPLFPPTFSPFSSSPSAFSLSIFHPSIPNSNTPLAGQGRDQGLGVAARRGRQLAGSLGDGRGLGEDTGSAPSCQSRAFRTPSCFHPNGPCSSQSRRQESPRRAIYLMDFCSRILAAASNLPARSVQEQLGQD